MPEPARSHRLEGLEPDNLLAFLALLGLLRALEAVRDDWRPRAAWDIDFPPLRPVLTLAAPATPREVCETVAAGTERLLQQLDFGDATDLKMDRKRARALCQNASKADGGRYFADLCAALVSDAATDQEQIKVEPTPFAYPSVATSNFLKNLMFLSRSPLPEKRGRDPSYPADAAVCVAQALFESWRRLDRPVGLRWDPDEAKRHAYRWRAPTKDLPTTQHGANRLAVVGLSVLSAVPVVGSGTRVHLSVLGGDGTGDRFTVAWPIWTRPASLAAIRALLSHPDLRRPGALDHLGVDHVRVARRISLDRLRNFTAAPPPSGERHPAGNPG